MVNAVFKVKGMEGSDLMKEYVEEIARTNIESIPEESKHNFKKDNFIVYAIKMKQPKLTLMAFTNQKYPEKQAHDCLTEYKIIVLKEFNDILNENYLKNKNNKIKSAQRLLETYYSEYNKMIYQNKKKRLDDMYDRAQRNFENVKKSKEETDGLRQISDQMDKQVDGFKKDFQKKNKDMKCLIC